MFIDHDRSFDTVVSTTSQALGRQHMGFGEVSGEIGERQQMGIKTKVISEDL